MEVAGCQERPYHDDSTASRLLSEVKHRRAWLVLRWGTTLESQVLFFCYFYLSRPHDLLHIASSLSYTSYILYLTHCCCCCCCCCCFSFSFSSCNHQIPLLLFTFIYMNYQYTLLLHNITISTHSSS